MKAESEFPVVTKRVHLITFVVALLACLIVVIWMVGPYLLSLFLGGALAMLAYPAYRWLKVRGWGPRVAATSVTAVMLVLVVAPLTGFAILAVNQGISIGQDLAELKEFSPKEMSVDLSRWQIVRTLIGEPAVVRARLKGAIQTAGQITNTVVIRLGRGVPKFLVEVMLTVVAFFFFLLDGKRFIEWLLGLGVLDRNVQEQLVESFRETTISVILAGLAAAGSLAALISIGFLVLGVPGAFLAGGLTFIFAWIPLLGTAPALIGGSLYLFLMEGASLKLGLMLLLGAVTSIVDHLVRPLVLKGRAGMHSLVGLVAILGGIRMFGIMGVFIGPVLAAMLLSLLRIWPVIGGRFGIDSKAG